MLTIVGAGMAGLLAANLMSRRDPIILEVQPTLPNNHSATLRFRTGAVGDATGIPFKRVNLIKGALPWRNEVADALSYSFKNTGIRRSDRSIVEGLKSEERFIAPPNFVTRLAAPVFDQIEFGKTCSFDRGGPYISTIPMPALASALGYPHQDEIAFKALPGTNVRAKLAHTEAYVSLLVPDPAYSFTRVTITGDELIVETPGELKDPTGVTTAITAAGLLEIGPENLNEITVHPSRYQKILPIDESARRRFLHWATDKHNVFSLGRYATARPGLLLDSLIQDVRLISGWIDSGHYEVMKTRSS